MCKIIKTTHRWGGVLLLLCFIFSISNVTAAGNYTVKPVVSQIPALNGGVWANDTVTIDSSLARDGTFAKRLSAQEKMDDLVVNHLDDTFSLGTKYGSYGAYFNKAGKTVVYNDDNCYILIKNFLKYRGEWYDLKYIIKQVNNNMSIQLPESKHKYTPPLSFGPDYLVPDSLINKYHSWGEVKVKVQILKKDGSLAKIPDLMIGFDDLDIKLESGRIENFTINRGNTFLYIPTHYKILGNTVYGTQDTDLYNPIYFKGTGIENGEVTTWLGTPRGTGSSTCWTMHQIYLKRLDVKYEANDGGKVIGIKAERVRKGDFPSMTEVKANENYKFTYWTSDKELKTLSGKKIDKNKKIEKKDLDEVLIEEPTTFTAHFEKEVGSLKINKVR